MSGFKSGDKVLAEVYIIGVARTQGEERYIVTDDDKYAAETLAIKMDRAHPIPTKTYEDGLREAWELARRIIFNREKNGFSCGDLVDIFKTDYVAEIFARFTAQEAAAKIAEWEAQKEIHVNDEVCIKSNGIRGVVLYSYDDGRIDVLFKNRSHDIYKTSDLVKTGRTIDIAGLLAQIGGTQP